MAINVEAEIRDLKRRISELEGSSGFLTDQVKNVHKDLLAFQERTEARFDRLEHKVDGLDRRVGGLNDKIDSLDRKIEAKVDGLAKALPGIVGHAVREANRERGK
jgi:predicted  nucleic acid-binding Zn-ribbon protein